jgi:FkbM family methyltransferase
MVGALAHIYDKSKPKCNGIIHVGGHFGQEIPFYLDKITKNIIVYEPLQANFKQLFDKFGYVVDCRKKAVGNYKGKVKLHVETANAGQSSSVLKPKEHLSQYPTITFDSEEECDIVKLDEDINGVFDTLVVDVQGYELEVFKGAANLLRKDIKYVICEVNCVEMYEGCAKVEDLDKFFEDFNFKRIITSWEGENWGNALYARF